MSVKLCPKVKLRLGELHHVHVDELSELCPSLTADTCAMYYDELATASSARQLRRSAMPTCDVDQGLQPDGPALKCTSSCFVPCPN